MAGQPLLKQTSQTSRALELRFFEILGGAFAITEKESFFNIRGSALPSPTYLRPPKRGLRVGGSGYAQAGLNLSPQPVCFVPISRYL